LILSNRYLPICISAILYRYYDFFAVGSVIQAVSRVKLFSEYSTIIKWRATLRH
jgi:hypothetical protein